MNRVDMEIAYNRWWKGKKCRVAGQGGAFELVKEVQYLSSPSGVYGTVVLVFENGGTAHPGTHKFRASKKDVEVFEETGVEKALGKTKP